MLSSFTIGSIGSLGNAAMNLFLGSIPAWIGFLLAQASAGLFALLMWLGTGQEWFALGYFLLGGYRAARPLIFAQIRVFIHETQMGLAYGIAETVNALTVILAPLLAGILYTRDPLMVYCVSLALTGVALVISGIVSPRRKTDLPVPIPVDIHHPPME